MYAISKNTQFSRSYGILLNLYILPQIYRVYIITNNNCRIVDEVDIHNITIDVFIFQDINMSYQGHTYGFSRKNGLGGLFSRSSGLGPGQRHGMSGKGVGTMKKARDMVLGDGSHVVVDIICRRCGHEQPHNYYRCRCQNCDGPLQKVDRDLFMAINNNDNNSNKKKLKVQKVLALNDKNMVVEKTKTVTGLMITHSANQDSDLADDNFQIVNVNQLRNNNSNNDIVEGDDERPEFQLTISAPKTIVKMSPMTQSLKHQKTFVSGTARMRDVGGLKVRDPGLGPGSRHGMSGRDVGTMTKVRCMILGNGMKISVDIVCRRCGHEQPSNYFRLRCQRCDGILKQLGANEKSEKIRSVGGIYKQPTGNQPNMKVTHDEHIRYDKRHAIEDGVTYNSFSKTTTRARTDDDVMRLIKIENTKKRTKRGGIRKGMGDKYIYPTDLRDGKNEVKPPSVTNVRTEAVEVQGNWIKAIALKTGIPYFYNAKTKVATWDSTAFDRFVKEKM